MSLLHSSINSQDQDIFLYLSFRLLVNIPAAVVALLWLNPVVDILTVQPAVIFSAV